MADTNKKSDEKPAVSTTSTYMKFGDIKGNVSSTGHEDWIHLERIEFGVSRQFVTQPGQVHERESSHPNFSEVRVIKKLDSASPELFLAACEGQEGQPVQIDLCKTGASQISSFMEYTLDNVLVGDYSIKHDNTGKPYEEVSLHFDKIQMAYKPSDQANKEGNQIVAGYDLATGQKT